MRFILLSLFSLSVFFCSAQSVGVNNNNPHPSSILDVQSADKGLLIPRMLKAARLAINAPANGLMVYQSGPDSTGFYYYHTNWHYLNYDSMLPPTAMLLSATYPNARLENNNFNYKGKVNMPGASITNLQPIVSNVWLPVDSLLPNYPTLGAIDFFSTWADSVYYITGGLQATSSPGGLDFYKFNPTTNKWTLAQTTFSKVPQGAAQARVGNKWVFWGGYANFSDGKALGAFVYDLSGNTFTQSVLPNDSARRFHTANAVGNNVYFWGGAGVTTYPYSYNTGYYYNTLANNWTKMNNTGSPQARIYAGAVAAGTDIVIWGGFNIGAGSILNNGSIYRTTTNTWTTISATNAPTGSMEPAMAYYNNNVYVISGAQTKMLNTTTNTWTTLAPPPTTFSGQKFYYDGAGRIMVFGGGRYFFPGVPGNTGYIYDIPTNTYTTLSAGAALQARAGHTICANGAGTWFTWGGSHIAGGLPAPEAALKSGALFYLDAANVLITQPLGDLFLYEKK